MAGFLSTGISITILAAVLPQIAREFHVGTATIAWVVTGPMLVMGVLTQTMGKAADLYGWKRIYIASWALFAAIATAAAFSWSAGALITLRVLGAAAGAATAPAAMALILAAFPPSRRVTAMGWWSFTGAGAPVIGLVIGGPLVDLFGWRWIFAVQGPLAVPGLVLAVFVLRRDEARERPAFDVGGSVALGCAVASLLYGINRAGVAGWAKTEVVLPLLLFPVFAAAFVAIERRHPAPLLPLAYFRRRNVSIPVAVQLLSHIPYMGSYFISPFLLQSALGYDTTRTALGVLPRPLANSVFSFVAGYAAVKLGERGAAVAGTAVLTGGIGVMATIGAESSFAHVAIAMAFTGAGMGLAFPGLVSSVANSVSEQDFGAISAMQNMAQMIGMVAGMQGLQTFQAMRARVVGEVVAYQQAFVLGAAIAFVSLMLAGFIRSMHRPQPVPPSESPEAPYVPLASAGVSRVGAEGISAEEWSEPSAPTS